MLEIMTMGKIDLWVGMTIKNGSYSLGKKERNGNDRGSQSSVQNIRRFIASDKTNFLVWILIIVLFRFFTICE